jgi:hypothetical protein
MANILKEDGGYSQDNLKINLTVSWRVCRVRSFIGGSTKVKRALRGLYEDMFKNVEFQNGDLRRHQNGAKAPGDPNSKK